MFLRWVVRILLLYIHLPILSLMTLRHGRRLFVPLAMLSEPTLKRQYKSEEQVNASPSDLSSLHLPDESTNFDTTGPALIYFSHSRFMTASAIFMPSTAADVIPPA